MAPMAIGLGSGEQLQRPLAITIIGGLSLTTILTLFFTPILYELAHRIPRPATSPVGKHTALRSTPRHAAAEGSPDPSGGPA